MANKLKNMQLTSVDLVRAGANQEADICLFKSAGEPEAPKSPTEPEKNILKRFIDWLNKNPQEAEIEAENTIEKADETAELYKAAITKSIQSIVSDDTLTPEQKNTMIEKSLGQYHEKMAEIAKFNPYHGADGRFASAGSAASFTYAPGKSKAHDAAIAREKERQASAGAGEKKETKANQEQIDRVKRFEEDLISELQSNIKPEYRDEFNTIHALLNDATMEKDIQRVKTSVENNNKEEMKRLSEEFKRTATEYAEPWFDEELGYEREGYEWESNFYNKLADLCKSAQYTSKSYDTIDEVEKNYEEIIED